jgi:predicted peptidase
VLHPYGRYCCANKFAGEIDLLEAIDHANKFYAIDEDRVIVRGFSMGGAAAWQFAVNYAEKWCAANPGAGFSETPEFLGGFQSEDVSGAPWYQQKLWHWYNATDNALNLENCPTVAYSGEIDKQKQAADVMERTLRGENVDLLHIIGPQTATQNSS